MSQHRFPKKQVFSYEKNRRKRKHKGKFSLFKKKVETNEKHFFFQKICKMIFLQKNENIFENVFFC